MVVGPGAFGAAEARAIFGIGPDWFDIFGDDKKSDMHHPRPGSEVRAQSTGSAARVAAAEAPQAKVGSVPEGAGTAATTGAPANVSAPSGIAESFGNGGGGGLPRTNIALRPGNLPRVSTAPVTRSVVIRGTPRAATNVPAVAPAELPQAPAVVPLAAPPPVSPEPEGRPAPAAPAPPPWSPPAKNPLAPSDSGVARVPESFRVGYAEYLRTASTTELFAAALPGVAGIAGFTVIGAYAGYRQARALRRALLAPVPTSFLL